MRREESGLRDGEDICDSGGVRIWYRVEGSRAAGTPIVLQHGGPGATARPFERTIGPLLARSRPVIYLDTRGAGRSDRPDDPAAYSLAALAADLESLRRHLAIERWALFGHSLGAAAVLTWAADHLQNAAAVVLCAPLLDGPANLAWSIAAKVARAPASVAAEARAVFRSGSSPDEVFSALLRLIDQRDRYAMQFFEPDDSAIMGALQDGLAEELGRPLMSSALLDGLRRSGLARFDGFALLDRLTMPQAVLIGPFDSEVSVGAAMRYVAGAPDAELTLFRRSGHHPYLEETAACARAIEAFLQGRGL